MCSCAACDKYTIDDAIAASNRCYDAKLCLCGLINPRTFTKKKYRDLAVVMICNGGDITAHNHKVARIIMSYCHDDELTAVLMKRLPDWLDFKYEFMRFDSTRMMFMCDLFDRPYDIYDNVMIYRAVSEKWTIGNMKLILKKVDVDDLDHDKLVNSAISARRNNLNVTAVFTAIGKKSILALDATTIRSAIDSLIGDHNTTVLSILSLIDLQPYGDIFEDQLALCQRDRVTINHIVVTVFLDRYRIDIDSALLSRVLDVMPLRSTSGFCFRAQNDTLYALAIGLHQLNLPVLVLIEIYRCVDVVELIPMSQALRLIDIWARFKYIREALFFGKIEIAIVISTN